MAPRPQAIGATLHAASGLVGALLTGSAAALSTGLLLSMAARGFTLVSARA